MISRPYFISDEGFKQSQVRKGEWTCSIAEFTGTHKGQMVRLDGKTIEPTNKKFKVDFCTVAHWKNGRIDEENLFYDLVGMMKQLGTI